MKKFLCKIGFHDWRLLGFTSLLLSSSLEVCRECGVGREFCAFASATIRHSAQEMREYMKYCWPK